MTDQWFHRNNSFQISYFSTPTSLISYPMDLLQIHESSHGFLFPLYGMTYTRHVNKTDSYSTLFYHGIIILFPLWIITKSKLIELSKSVVKESPWLFNLDEILIVIVPFIGILRNCNEIQSDSNISYLSLSKQNGTI